MSDRCRFEGSENFCAALIEKKCKNCKFRKTEEEYLQGQVGAAAMLERKDLIPIKKMINGVAVMSTQFYRRW